MAKKTKKELEELRKLRALIDCFRRHGITVRREKLSRGPAFRVKSGKCLLSGENLIFLDKRLPDAQQTSMLLDFLVESEFKLSEEDLSSLPAVTQKLLQEQVAA